MMNSEEGNRYFGLDVLGILLRMIESVKEKHSYIILSLNKD